MHNKAHQVTPLCGWTLNTVLRTSNRAPVRVVILPIAFRRLLMLFDQSVIDLVDQSPIEGLREAIRISNERRSEMPPAQFWMEKEVEIMLESAVFFDLVIKNKNINVKFEVPKLSSENDENGNMLNSALVDLEKWVETHFNELKTSSLRNQYNVYFRETFAYEFSQGDLVRIQTLINELRDQISANHELEPNHKQRLLKRLESLQSELHKRVSDLDRFWGLIGDAGVVLGKLGKDAKPIVDRIKEIAEVVWKTQARSEELPSDSENPMIERE